jgi:hypothetical protein
MTLAGCRATEAPRTTYVPLDRTMPPNTVLFSTVMGDLGAQPGFFDKLAGSFGSETKTGAAIFSPKIFREMRIAIARDPHSLDRFPGWEMADINPLVDLSGDIDHSVAIPPERPLTAYIDLGDYALNRTQPIDLDQPSTLPGFSTEGLVAPVGSGIVRGDGPNPDLAPMHSESARLAEVLNRLVLNGHPGNRLEAIAPITATLEGHTANTPEGLIGALLATGHQVSVADARYFANFGHLHYEGEDVMMPFWVNAGVQIPRTNRQLLVPVSHAEYEWFVRGPKINADVAFYFGIDGKAEFRTMDQLDQRWVMGRHAHEYRDADAVEVTRLAGLLAIAYAHAHLANPRLAFGGYYTLGVCQDGVAAIEQKMTGETTLFPNTADMTYFKDSRDAEIDSLLAAIPKDRNGGTPQLERVFGSLPTTDLAAITIPGLASDLEAVQKAARNGSLENHARPLWEVPLAEAALLAVALITIQFIRRKRRLAP